MARLDALTRYIRIIQKLKRNPADFQQIADYLEQESEISGLDLHLSQRTLQRDIIDIRTIFGIDIANNRSKKKYYIADGEPSEMTDRMMEAFDTFNELVTRFPNSRYTPDAVQRMRYLVNSLAQHEVHVARYYYRRGAYVAAVNRSQAAIKDYPDAPAIEEALFIMRDSYEAMGLKELRDDVERVIRMNFPNSVYFSGGPTENKPWWQLW